MVTTAGAMTISGVAGQPLLLQTRDGCPACRHKDHVMHIAFGEICVVRCVSCGFLYSDAVMSDQSMERFYAVSYGGLRHRQGQQVNARTNMQALQRLIKLDAGSRVLEIGSGYGFLLRVMRERMKIIPIGVELSKEESEYSRQVNGIETHDVSIDRAPLQRESFDLVACFETIEHVPDPVVFLHTLVDYVRPGGALLVMTDNFESDVARSMGAYFPKWIPHQHVCHFTDTTLPSLLEQDSALRIERVLSYTPWELRVRALLSRGRDRSGGHHDFELTKELGTEMTRGYRLFRLRRMMNQIWARYSFREDLRGALMYVLARKRIQRAMSSAAA